MEDRLEELGVDPMRTKITEEELETARARLAGERASKVSWFRTEILQGSAKRLGTGCVNAAGKLRQK